MQKVAKFEKVSFEQFYQDWHRITGQDPETVKKIYDGIRLPERATAGSAGYDFYAPADFDIAPGEEILIPTGIRARITDGYVLMIFPRSGLGFKYRLQLNNTTGIIDADYYNAENEGHIMCKLINDSRQQKTVELRAGSGMVQGLFIAFGITEDDEADGQRTGGFGSTSV